MASSDTKGELVDLHELSAEGDFAALKEALDSSTTTKTADVNAYKLFVYRRTSQNSSADGLLDGDNEDDDEDYHDDGDSLDAGLMFDYRSPLFYAILNNRLACTKLLLEHGADTDKLRPWGLNALCLACSCGHTRLVEYLLPLSSNVNKTDNPNATDAYFASLPADHPHKVTMREMHSRVAQDLGMFHFPLHIAVKQDSVPVLTRLLARKEQVDIEIKEPYTKRTALHLAASKCSREVIALLLEQGQCQPNPLDLNGHTPLDIVWRLLNNVDYLFEYREETLKLMLSHKARFSSLKALTEFNTNALPAFRRFESNLWIVLAYDLPSLFLGTYESNKQLLVHVWVWFNRNYQDTVMDDEEYDRHYTGSILRNLIHVMYENEHLTLTSHELVELFMEDLGSHFDTATDEIDTITTILSTPLKLKQICRNRIRKRLCASRLGGLNRTTLEHPSLSPPLDERLRHFIIP